MLMTIAILAATAISNGDRPLAGRAVYESDEKLVGVDWDRRVSGAFPVGVAPSVLFESMRGEPRNVVLWKNARSCGVKTTLLELVIPSKEGRTVRTKKYIYEESVGSRQKRHFSVYDSARVKFLEYDYKPKIGVDAISLVSPISGKVSHTFELRSGSGFLSHCGW